MTGKTSLSEAIRYLLNLREAREKGRKEERDDPDWQVRELSEKSIG